MGGKKESVVLSYLGYYLPYVGDINRLVEIYGISLVDACLDK